MKQLGDVGGGVMEKLKGRRVSSCSRPTTGRRTSPGQMATIRIRGGKGTVMEGGMRVPMIARWPGHIPAARSRTDFMSGPDFFPTLTAIASDAHIKDELLTGKQLGDRPIRSIWTATTKHVVDRQGAVQPS